MKSRTPTVRVTRWRKPLAGLSLIELLVALAISGIVISAAGGMLLQGFSNEAQYRQQNTAQQNARTAADTLGDDIRGAKTGTVSAGAFTFASPMSCRLYADDGTERNVFWWRSSTVPVTLRRKVASTADTGPANDTDGTVVASGISTPVLTLAAKTASIEITGTAGTAPAINTVTIRTNVGIRNAMLP